MEAFSSIIGVFQAPWLLAGLLAVPALWWLMRHLPPKPRQVDFPATWIIARIQDREETPATTPWWLLALRALLLGCVIFGLARPLLNQQQVAMGDGPLILLLDNDWTTAGKWQDRLDTARALIDQAEQRGAGIALVESEPALGQERPRLDLSLMSSDVARERLSILAPRPWTAQRTALLEALDQATLPEGADVHWLWNGVGGSEAETIARRLRAGNRLTAHAPGPADMPFFISGMEERGDVLSTTVTRLAPAGEAAVSLIFSDADGNGITRRTATFADGETTASAELRLPAETIGQLARADIAGQESAAATFAFGEDWRRRRVGLVTPDRGSDSLPLTSPLYYINRALAPVTSVESGPLADMMADMDAIILTDQSLNADAIMRLSEWIEGGGLVLRFAGDRLAGNPDRLTPMDLRPGGREMGAAMTWDKPVPLGAFDDTSPFAGLDVPEDVTVSRQVLADPNSLSGAQVWAQLHDSTPLVTARHMGNGLLVMMHVEADPAYSTLPYSGLFVEMLERVVKLSGRRHAGQADMEAGMAARMVMDGFGRLHEPPAGLPGIAPGSWEGTAPSPLTPPGLYEGPQGSRALNLAGRGNIAGGPTALSWPPGVRVETMGNGAGTNLMPWLIVLAILLLGLDLVVSFARRLLPRRGLATASAAALMLLCFMPQESRAQNDPWGGPENERSLTPEEWAIEAAGETRLAYVASDDAGANRLTESGLRTLSNMLSLRTSVEPARPMAVNLERDDIAFFPVLYWAVTPPYPRLSPSVVRKLQAYMRTGGLLVVDTGDGAPLHLGQGSALSPNGQPASLSAFLDQFATQPLRPVDDDHVLTKSFYLLQDFPGRWTGQPVYVSAQSSEDTVSPIIVTSNGWAAGWALGNDNRPMVPIVPDGPMQQEMAWRTGINVMMYALTGTYKSDQVHVPALLERLGQ